MTAPILLTPTERVVDLPLGDGRTARAWVWTGRLDTGEVLEVYVTGVNVPGLAASAPADAELGGPAVPADNEIPTEELVTAAELGWLRDGGLPFEGED